MAQETKGSPGTQKESPKSGPRTWAFSLAWSALVVAISIVASATINPLFGRSVHWDWVAGIAPVSFIVLSLAFRRRWL